MQQNKLNLGTIGQKLEYARHQKGLSVSEVGRKTKILVKIIEAMEADNFAELSAPVYAKSFIRMYAKLLEINPDPLIHDYLENHAPKPTRFQQDEKKRSLTNLSISDENEEDTSTNSPKKLSPFGSSSSPINITLSPSNNSLKTGIIAGTLVLILIIIIFSVKECSGNKDPIPSPSLTETTQMERTPLISKIPDVYLTESDTVEVDLNKKQ